MQPAFGQPGAPAAELDALVRAAKAEGGLVFYTIAPENVIRPFANGFSEKYGVRADFVRLSSAALGQRHASELSAGNPAADLAFLNNADVFIRDGIQKGWLESVQEAGLPALRSGEYPSRFLRQNSAIVQTSPYHILYNTDRLKGGDVPRGWQDLLNPKYRGQILIADPSESDSLLDVWALLHDAYGDAFFAALRGQNPRWMSGTIGAVQSLGAGEGALQFPATRAVGLIIAAKGGPVDAVLPDPTTGTETYIMMTHRKLAKKPAAARLFANYFLSREGNLAYAVAGGRGPTRYTTRPDCRSSMHRRSRARRRARRNCARRLACRSDSRGVGRRANDNAAQSEALSSSGADYLNILSHFAL